MPGKRGRPLSGESDSAAINHRREQVRERVRQLRLRQRQTQAVGVPTSTVQHEQSEHIIDLPFVAAEEAAATSPAVGVRTSPDLRLPRDPLDALLQQTAQEVNQDESVYYSTTKSNGQRRRVPPGFFHQFAAKQRPSTESEGDFLIHNDNDDCNDNNYNNDDDDNDDNDDHSNSDDNGSDGENRNNQNNSDISNNENELPLRTDIAAWNNGAGLVFDRGSEDLIGLERLNSVEQDGLVNEVDDRSDSESEVSFVSEREVDEEGEAAYEYTAEKLYAQLQGGHHGCSEEQHTERLRKHMEEEGDNHHGLGAIFHNRRLPSALNCKGIMSAAELGQQAMPTADQWKAMFCGVPVEEQQHAPLNVCLHKEQTQAVEPRVVFDVDSYLGFWSSLAAAKQGLSWQPAAQAMQNIQTDVHLEMDAFEWGEGDDETLRACKKMLRDVPHFLLGRVHGANHITVHVLFPHLPTTARRDRFVSMTEEQSSRWADQIFHPAVWEAFPAHYTQHLPPTYRVAVADTKANQVEGRKIETSSYQAQQAIAYHLQPGRLEEVWRNVLQIIDDTPSLADFREPQIFFTAKGTKLTFQSRPSQPTLLDVMEHFESYLQQVIDMRYVERDRFYVDLGKEICPSVSLLPRQRSHVDDEAQVYSWKRCCLEEYMQWMYEGQPPSHRAQGQRYYHQNMLYDASSLTSVTPKKSRLRQGGLIYSQFYGSVKEMTDASKCKPFDNDALEEMALDPQLQRAASNVAGGHRRQTRIVEMAYIASKQRIRWAVLGSMRRSFGIREEHRITWDLFQGLKAVLEAEDRHSLEVTMTDCPSYAWPVRTKVYLDFLWRSADKYATGFEVVHARARKDMVTWEQTKMMSAFLRCLRYVMGGHRIEPESAMWWSKRTTGEAARPRSWYGLGFCNTLPRYKYCWWEPRLDWQRLCFQPGITNSMLFGNSVLRGEVMRRGRQVKAFFDIALAIERGLEWMRANEGNEVVREQVLSWMVHMCLQQFRVDVLRAVKAEIREEHQEEALKGERGFSYEYFEEIMRDGCYLMSGNRCDFKAPSLLASFLLDEGDGRTREHWEDKPFRKLYQRAKTGLGMQGRELKRKFMQHYWQWLFEFHWVLPYPCSNALLQTSKGEGRRMWYSIEQSEEGKGWKWGRKGWQAGRPREVPQYVGWSEEEWLRWMEERGGEEGGSE